MKYSAIKARIAALIADAEEEYKMRIKASKICQHCGGDGETKKYTGVCNDYDWENCDACEGTGVVGGKRAKEVKVTKHVRVENTLEVSAEDVVNALRSMNFPIPDNIGILVDPTTGHTLNSIGVKWYEQKTE